ncbi:hypothetical protein KPL35_13810 [Clostridium sp. CF011]|uniref:hypothetical protein n=2 Tax=Clostridium TaxID=1485 RepID=UPI001C0D5227|nr:hypothetical protein [Clostridium sp. CF011]MBU3093146.1 hypothetical protein [Clostridium sp. CF011]
MGKLYNALDMCSVFCTLEGRIFMNKNDLEEIKKMKKQSESNKGVSGASNGDVTNMYNMPNMASGPSDATPEEKQQLNARSEASKGTTEK